MSTNELRALALIGCGLLIASCDRKGSDMLPQPIGDHPDILEIGSLRVLGRNEVQLLRDLPIGDDSEGNDNSAQWSSVLTDHGVGDRYRDDLASMNNRYDWCDLLDEDGNRNCYYGQLGPPEPGKRGGGTFTFTAPSFVADTYFVDPDDIPGLEGSDLTPLFLDESSPPSVQEAYGVDTLCVVVDSENVFWNSWISPEPSERPYLLTYPDEPSNDGDIDIFGGMTSYYTGSPGLELGDFKGFYTDALGREIEIEFNECFVEGLVGEGIESHAGRGSLEYCELDVSGRAGIEFTILLDTFSVPLNDGALSFGAMVFAGPCGSTNQDNDLERDISMNECILPGESLLPDSPSSEPVLCTEALEAASCVSANQRAPEEGQLPPLQEFCCAHEGLDLELCNELDAPDDACQQFNIQYGADGGNSRSTYCRTHPERCCEYYEPSITDRYYKTSW